jgi:hypothetical protein
MSGRAVRTQALAATTSRPSTIHPGSGIETPAELFGRNVFTKAVMGRRRRRLGDEGLGDRARRHPLRARGSTR